MILCVATPRQMSRAPMRRISWRRYRRSASRHSSRRAVRAPEVADSSAATSALVRRAWMTSERPIESRSAGSRTRVSARNWLAEKMLRRISSRMGCDSISRRCACGSARAWRNLSQLLSAMSGSGRRESTSQARIARRAKSVRRSASPRIWRRLRSARAGSRNPRSARVACGKLGRD